MLPTFKTILVVAASVAVADLVGDMIVNSPNQTLSAFFNAAEIKPSDKYIYDAKVAALKGTIGAVAFALGATATVGVPSLKAIGAMAVATTAADIFGDQLVDKFIASPTAPNSTMYKAEVAAVKGVVGVAGFVAFHMAFGA